MASTMRMLQAAALEPSVGLLAGRTHVSQVRHGALVRQPRSTGHSKHGERLSCSGGSNRCLQGNNRVVRVAATAASAAGSPNGNSVGAVLFDMDGVLCDSEDPSREAAVALFKELGYDVKATDFIPFMGTGEANFLGGVARLYGVPSFDPDAAKKRFFDIYIQKYAKPNSGIGFPGALELIKEVKAAGIKVAVASSADRIKVDANLAAAGIPLTLFDAIVSADKFARLKPAPDIFLAASQELGVPQGQCVVIEDAVAGMQAAEAAGMRCIAVTTTLDEASIMSQALPALVRPDISKISLADIINANQDGSSKARAENEGQAVDSERSPVASGVMGWIDTPIALPGGVSTTRRNVIRLASLTSGLGIAGYALDNLKEVKVQLRTLGAGAVPWLLQLAILAYVSRAWPYWSKAFSYVSPQALLNLLTGSPIPPANAASGGLVKFLEQLEDTGGGRAVPDFQQGLAWLNCPPLSLSRELKGKVVLMDFWTYCCINCIHVLPDLAYLERKYKGQPVTVVGVHSAKFDNEKDLDAIRNAVLRYEVEHPVVNDGEMSMWRALGVSSWPTLALVSPKGRLIAMVAGEGNRQLLDDLISASLDFYGARGELQNEPPVPVSLERAKDQRLVRTPLKYPGKIATDLPNDRLFISDSNNHRIVVTRLDGTFITQVGGAGGEGLADGSFESALFNRPQGVAYHPGKDVLYVADTENHALREIDFAREQVRTLAGNGTKGRDYTGGGKGPEQLLNSPWDVTLSADASAVYIAMAGTHQIWVHDVVRGTSKVFSGNGYERNQNGRTASDTAYAQPSGLSVSADGGEMFCADSESSSVRAVNLRTGGSRLCAGGDATFAENLFKFGDRDGPSGRALLQHPLGVLTLDGSRVLVCDSYNHKIKVLDAAAGAVATLAGTGVAGFADGEGATSQFSEPAGLALGPNGSVLVADTNNSVIRSLTLPAPGRSGVAVATLDLSSVPLPSTVPPAGSAAPKRLRRRRPAEAQVVEVPPVQATSGTLVVDISIPTGYHFTSGVPSKFEVSTETEVPGLTVSPASGTLELTGQKAKTALTFELSQGLAREASASVFNVNCKVYYCQQDDVCLYQALSFKVPVGSGSQPQTGPPTELKFTVVPKSLPKVLFP